MSAPSRSFEFSESSIPSQSDKPEDELEVQTPNPANLFNWHFKKKIT